MHVKVTWITMLALSDRDGLVMASVPGLAHAARVSLHDCEEAIDRLSSPDPYSRTKAHGGRRIEAIDGGWLLLNHKKYRDLQDADERREQVRLAVARHRARKAEDVINGNPGNPALSPTPTDALNTDQSDGEAPPAYPFDKAWSDYPHYQKRSVKKQAEAAWVRARLDTRCLNVRAWLLACSATDDWRKEKGMYVPGMQTWLRSRDFSEPPDDAPVHSPPCACGHDVAIHSVSGARFCRAGDCECLAYLAETA